MTMTDDRTDVLHTRIRQLQGELDEALVAKAALKKIDLLFDRWACDPRAIERAAQWLVLASRLASYGLASQQDREDWGEPEIWFAAAAIYAADPSHTPETLDTMLAQAQGWIDETGIPIPVEDIP